MEDQLTRQQIAEVKNALLFDKGGDGSITVNELSKMLGSLGKYPTEAELNDVINEIASDGNGFIGFSKFLDMIAHKMKKTSAGETIEAFCVFQRDEEGRIIGGEIRQSMGIGKQLTDKDVEYIVREADGYVRVSKSLYDETI